jgi:penicillin-binding protein 2
LAKYNKPWYMGETLISSIGQGYFLVTPIQITRYTALLATDRLPTPHLIKYKGDEEIKYTSKDVLTPFQKSKMYLLRKGMYQVVNSNTGTAYRYLAGTKVEIAGKTGTAQVTGIAQEEKRRIKESDMEYYKRSHAWFTAYAPFKNPKYVITVLVEHGGHGGEASGTITRDIVNKLVELGYLGKDES